MDVFISIATLQGCHAATFPNLQITYKSASGAFAATSRENQAIQSQSCTCKGSKIEIIPAVGTYSYSELTFEPSMNRGSPSFSDNPDSASRRPQA